MIVCIFLAPFFRSARKAALVKVKGAARTTTYFRGRFRRGRILYDSANGALRVAPGAGMGGDCFMLCISLRALSLAAAQRHIAGGFFLLASRWTACRRGL